MSISFLDINEERYGGIMDDVTRTDPLRPIEFTTKWLSLLFGGFVVAYLVLLPFGGGLSLENVELGEADYVCVDARPQQGAIYHEPASTVDDDRPVSTGPGYFEGMTRQATVSLGDVRACSAGGPTSVYQHSLRALADIPPVVTFAGLLVVLRLLIHRARRDGLFSAGVARLTRVLGWYVLVSMLVGATVSAWAETALLDTLIPGTFSAGSVYAAFDGSWTLVLVAIGVLTIARVLRIAVGMREDLDATV
jgi:hypothetical protein